MFYPELSELRDGSLFDIVDKLDEWLAFLPEQEQNKITVSKVSIKLKIDYNIANALLDKCVELKILEKLFAITCPNCEHVLKITDAKNLYEEVISLSYCYSCDKENLQITGDNIIIIYKLIKKPTNSPDNIRKQAYEKLGLSEESDNIFQDNLNFSILNGKCNPNSFFYNPSNNQKAELINLYEKLDGTFSTAKFQGDALEDVALYLLNIVKCFQATKKAKTSTNQLDCFVRNNLFIKSSVLEELGAFFVCECKHEKDANVPNTYYHKIIDIISLMKSPHEKGFGIIFSIKPPTQPCYIISRETFLQKNIVVINICKTELEEIIKSNHNLLDLIERKIIEVKNGITTPLDEIGL